MMAATTCGLLLGLLVLVATAGELPQSPRMVDGKDDPSCSSGLCTESPGSSLLQREVLSTPKIGAKVEIAADDSAVADEAHDYIAASLFDEADDEIADEADDEIDKTYDADDVAEAQAPKKSKSRRRRRKAIKELVQKLDGLTKSFESLTKSFETGMTGLTDGITGLSDGIEKITESIRSPATAPTTTTATTTTTASTTTTGGGYTAHPCTTAGQTCSSFGGVEPTLEECKEAWGQMRNAYVESAASWNPSTSFSFMPNGCVINQGHGAQHDGRVYFNKGAGAGPYNGRSLICKG